MHEIRIFAQVITTNYFGTTSRKQPYDARRSVSQGQEAVTGLVGIPSVFSKEAA